MEISISERTKRALEIIAQIEKLNADFCDILADAMSHPQEEMNATNDASNEYVNVLWGYVAEIVKMNFYESDNEKKEI